jgi:hypothetical protein
MRRAGWFFLRYVPVQVPISQKIAFSLFHGPDPLSALITKSRLSVLFDGVPLNEIMPQSIASGEVLAALGNPENTSSQHVFEPLPAPRRFLGNVYVTSTAYVGRVPTGMILQLPHGSEFKDSLARG